MNTNHLPPEETALRHKQICDLTRTGHSAPQIAIIVGITERSVQRARVKHGISQPYNGKPLTQHELQQAEDLLDDGASYNEVARTIGRSDVIIRRRFPGRSQWINKNGSEYRRLMEALDAIPAPGVA